MFWRRVTAAVQDGGDKGGGAVRTLLHAGAGAGVLNVSSISPSLPATEIKECDRNIVIHQRIEDRSANQNNNSPMSETVTSRWDLFSCANG